MNPGHPKNMVSLLWRKIGERGLLTPTVNWLFHMPQYGKIFKKYSGVEHLFAYNLDRTCVLIIISLFIERTSSLMEERP
jgi:hypothetical protein